MEYQGITVTRDGDLYIDLPGLYFYSINEGHCPPYDVLEGRSLLIFNNLSLGIMNDSITNYSLETKEYLVIDVRLIGTFFKDWIFKIPLRKLPSSFMTGLTLL
jgi:hypothetical protein